jgi:heat shock protein 4
VTNTITGMKLLVGRKFDDADLQKELSRFPFKAVKMPHGGVGISILYNDEPMVVSAEHFMAMMLVKAREIVNHANNGVNLADSVLAVPNWYTQSQRRGVLNSCEIGGVNCLKVANEMNTIALSYGIFKSAKKLFSETEPTHVMFIDLGYTVYSVTIVDFIQENMKVLSTVCDRTVGGRDFDDIIIEFLAETFEKKTKINVRNNKKAVLKLQAAAEKAKKTLSPAGVNEANISVECLAEDMDLNAVLTREEFESRAATLVDKLRAPIEVALKEANLAREKLAEIEIVGGTTRVNIVKRKLGEILGLDASALNYGLKTTMNADEAVARGGALQCAMLSSRMKVKPFNIVDRLYYGVVAHFDNHSGDDSAMGDEDETAAKGTSVSLYQRNDEVPHKPRRITFRNKTSDFAITLSYDDASTAFLPAGESRFISKHTIRVPATYSDKPSDVRVTFALDRHGLVHVQSAQLMEELSAEEIAKLNAAENKSDGKEPEESKEASKKKYKKVDLKVDTEEPGLTRDQIKAALELEASMAFEDRLIVETADKRNELESYIYAMRDKLDGNLRDYASSQEKDSLKSAMNVAEDWLYNEGFDSTKQEYSRRIEDLRRISNPVEFRLHQVTARPGAIDALKKQLELCKSFASNYDEAHSHITDDERDRIRKEVQSTESWLYDNISKQEDLPKYANPVLTSDSINAKRTALFNVTNPIMIKPKPKPAEATPPPAPEAKSTPADEKSSPKDDSVPMDQAKGGPEEDAADAGAKK